MYSLKETPGRTCRIQGKKFLFFSGYSYLGMSHVKEFTSLVKEGINRYGVLFPSSRISNTRLDLFEKFEHSLSYLTGLDQTVTFSSGFLAGKTIADIISSHENIFTAPGTHPAIKVSNTETGSNNIAGWKKEIVEKINIHPGKEFVLQCDSVDIMKAVIHDFSFIENIIPSKKIIFIIDDSHGIGIIGKNGEGIISRLPKREHIEYIICYSLSKAFNIEGGAISCSHERAESLRQHPNYTASTAMNPSLVYAFLNSEEIYAAQRERLFENIDAMKDRLPSFILQHPFDLPIFICEKEDAESAFYKNRIIISSFGYPYPDSRKINRIVVNALHTKKDIQKLCKI